MIGLGLVCGLLIWIATYKIKERPEFSQVDKPIPLKEALKATLTNKNFIVFDIANFMAVFMFSICMGAIFTFQTMLPSRIPYTFGRAVYSAGG